MNITILLFLLVLSAVMQNKRDRFIVSVIYASIIALSDIIIGDTGGESYFLLDGLSNLFILIALSSMVIINDLARKLSIVCLLSVLANVVGWIMWENYLPIQIYNIMFVGLYSYAVIIILTPEPQDVGNNTNNIDRPSFYFTFTEQLYHSFKNKG